MKNSILKGFVWKFLERFGVASVQFILQIILARLLAPQHYGILSIMIIFTTLATVFVQNGFNTALIQNKDVTEEDYSSVFWVSLGIAGILYGIIFVVAPLIAKFYEMPDIVFALRVLALMLFPGALNSIQIAKVNREMDFRKVFISNTGAVVISGVVGIVIAYLGGGLWALVVQTLLNSFIACIVMFFTVRIKWRFVCNFKRVKVLFAFGWKLLVSSLLDTLYQDLRSLVVGKKYDSGTLGYYDRGKQFPQFATNVVNGAVQSVMLPAMAEKQEDKNNVKKIMRSSMTITAFIMFPAMIGLAAVATPLVRLLLTDKWLPCVPFMQIYCCSFAFYPVHTCNLQAINALGRSDMYLKLEVIKKSYGILALVIAVVCFESPIAIATTGLITAWIGWFVNSFPNRKLLNYSFPEQIKDILPSILLSAFMGVIVFCVQFIGLSDITTLLIQVPLGVAIYVLGAKIFKIESFQYILNLIKSFIKKRKTIKASAKDIEEFLLEIDKDFPVPLSKKVNISEFSKKLFEKATIITKIKDKKIISMLAGYTENTENDLAYVSILATTKEYRGQGLAGKSLDKFIKLCKKKDLKGVHLYTVKTNTSALAVYHKRGFTEYVLENESRPNDLHLVLHFKEND